MMVQANPSLWSGKAKLVYWGVFGFLMWAGTEGHFLLTLAGQAALAWVVALFFNAEEKR